MMKPGVGLPRTWIWLSIAAAIAAMAANVIGLLVPSIYSRLTPAFLPQAYAQDVANLILVSPAMLILAILTLRGSVRAYLLWLGTLAFSIYNYVIYAFSIPFGPLFLAWVAVLSLCLYALIGGIVRVNHESIRAYFVDRRRTRFVGWALGIVAAFFAFVWLSEDVPALIAGATPASLIALGIPTNPVHILDLAFFLPAAFLTAAMLLKESAARLHACPRFHRLPDPDRDPHPAHASRSDRHSPDPRVGRRPSHRHTDCSPCDSPRLVDRLRPRANPWRRARPSNPAPDQPRTPR